MAKNGSADLSGLSSRDREYLAAWDTLSMEERGAMAKMGIYGPLPVGKAAAKEEALKKVGLGAHGRGLQLPAEGGQSL